jgi:glyoxylase-like metal-dependent hydrolase (beta-lactamase superfamily II)
MDGRGFQVAPGIHRIEAPLGDRFVACHLVIGSRAAVLVDTGIDSTPAGSIAPYCDAIGLDREAVRWIVVSHDDVDHMGGNASAAVLFPRGVFVAHELDIELVEDVDRIVRERYSEFAADHGIDVDDAFKAWCHEIARPVPIDLRITARASIALGDRTVAIIPTPGHSWGSVSVWDPHSGSAMIGDAVLGATVRTADGRPAFPPTYRYPAAYRRTIAELDALAPQWLLAAHEPVMDGASARAFLAESAAFADRLEAAALDLLDATPGGLTTRDLAERIAPDVGSWPPSAWIFLANELIGHLEEALVAGRVEAEREPGGRLRWRALDRAGTGPPGTGRVQP